MKVTLDKVSIFSENFKVTTQSGDTYNTLSYSSGLFYRGAISGTQNALVTVNFFKDSMTGVLSLNGENFNIGPYGEGETETFVLFKERNLNASNPFACSTEDPKELFFAKPTNRNSNRSRNNSVEIYVECDHFLYQAHGASADRTTDFVTGLFNVISAIYAVDDIEVKLGEVKIWTSPDPVSYTHLTLPTIYSV